MATSATSSQIWTKLIGTAGSEVGWSVAQGSDGAVYVVGSTNGALDGMVNAGTDAFITKFDAGGTTAWTKLLGSVSTDLASTIAIGTDGSIFVTGYTAEASTIKHQDVATTASLPSFYQTAQRYGLDFFGRTSLDFIHEIGSVRMPLSS
jgi:hypothetical protein